MAIAKIVRPAFFLWQVATARAVTRASHQVRVETVSNARSIIFQMQVALADHVQVIRPRKWAAVHVYHAKEVAFQIREVVVYVPLGNSRILSANVNFVTMVYPLSQEETVKNVQGENLQVKVVFVIRAQFLRLQNLEVRADAPQEHFLTWTAFVKLLLVILF